MTDDPRIHEPFHQRIDRAMDRLRQTNGRATIGDALAFFQSQGNADYWKMDTSLDPEKIETPLKLTQTVGISHDISHIAARLGLTPQHEQWSIPFELGLKWGAARAIMEDQYKPNHSKNLEGWVKSYQASDRTYFLDPETASILPPDKKQTAINYAAGIYLREKIDQFYAQGFSQKSYDEQRTFATEYANNDYALALDHNKLFHFKIDESFPYELITLSRAEWRAITEVATGLSMPQDTAYPERLNLVQRALDGSELGYDIKPHAENALRYRALQDELETDPEKPKQALDPERFQKTREARIGEGKQGAARFIREGEIALER